MNIKKIALVGALIVQSGSMVAVNWNPFTWGSKKETSVTQDIKDLTIHSVETLTKAVEALKAKHDAKKDVKALEEDIKHIHNKATAHCRTLKDDAKTAFDAALTKAKESFEAVKKEYTDLAAKVKDTADAGANAAVELARKAKEEGKKATTKTKGYFSFITDHFNKSKPVKTDDSAPASNDNNSNTPNKTEKQSLTWKEMAKVAGHTASFNIFKSTEEKALIKQRHDEITLKEEAAKESHLINNALKIVDKTIMDDSGYASFVVAKGILTNGKKGFRNWDQFVEEFDNDALKTKAQEIRDIVAAHTLDFVNLPAMVQNFIMSHSQACKQAVEYVKNTVKGNAEELASYLRLEERGQRVALIACVLNKCETREALVEYITKVVAGQKRLKAAALRAVDRIVPQPMSTLKKATLGTVAAATVLATAELGRQGVLSTIKDIVVDTVKAELPAVSSIASGVSTAAWQVGYVVKDAFIS